MSFSDNPITTIYQVPNPFLYPYICIALRFCDMHPEHYGKDDSKIKNNME